MKSRLGAERALITQLSQMIWLTEKWKPHLLHVNTMCKSKQLLLAENRIYQSAKSTIYPHLFKWPCGNYKFNSEVLVVEDHNVE